MVKHIRVIELTGTPYERGLKYGQEVKKELHEVLIRWKYFLKIKLNIHDFDTFVLYFMKNTHFVEAVQKWTPKLFDEVKGLAEGANVDFNTIFSFHCQDEIFWLNTEHSFNPTQYDSSQEHCTALGISKKGDTPTICGQNVDYFNTLDPFHCVLHIKDPATQSEQYINSFIGCICWTGMNNVPISINANTLFLNTSITGLPVVFVMRGVLQQKNITDAINFIKRVPHASGQNYIIGCEEKAIDFECSASKVVQYIPKEGVDRVYHTNHYFVNDDVVLPPMKFDYLNSSTFPRYEYVDYRLNNPEIPVDLDVVKNVLRSHIGSVCVHHENKAAQGGTSASVIAVLSKENPQFLVTNGPPCLSTYTAFEFTDYELKKKDRK